MVRQLRAWAAHYARRQGWWFFARLADGGRNEPVELLQQRYNFLPHRFRLRGNVWHVQAILAVHDHASERMPRRSFEVVCRNGGHFVLQHDLRVGTWHV